VPASRPGHGFTLIELMIVVALVAVAAGVVSLALRDPAATRLETEAQRLSALLESARAESRVSGLTVLWLPLDEQVEADFRFVQQSGAKTRPMPLPTRSVPRIDAVNASSGISACTVTIDSSAASTSNPTSSGSG